MAASDDFHFHWAASDDFGLAIDTAAQCVKNEPF
jgi:hypothetical protein